MGESIESGPHIPMPTDQDTYQLQGTLGSFSDSTPNPTKCSFESPPIPSDQDEIELLSPRETLAALRDQEGDISSWLRYVKQQYTPPEEKDVLLLYPCAATKPMPDSRTYASLWNTLDRYAHEDRRRIHIVTVSEPMALIPLEYQSQDGSNPTWLYDTPGLFRWWCKDNNTKWDKQAQQMSLQILGKHIGGFLERAEEQGWYETKIACVRHLTPSGGTSIDQTHRQMLEVAEGVSGVDLEWLPSADTIEALTEKQKHAYTMQGVSYDPVQTELSALLTKALDETRK